MSSLNLCLLYVASAVAVWPALVSGYANFVPDSKCSSLRPGHGSEGGRSYTLNVGGGVSTYSHGTPVTVTVSGGNYQAIILQARRADGSGGTTSSTPIGTWSAPPSHTQLKRCSANDDTVTHSNTNAKTSATTYTWNPPSSTSGDIVFIATVAQSKSRYRRNILSAPLTLADGGNGGTPTDGGNAGTPTDGGNAGTPTDGGNGGTPTDGGNENTPSEGGDANIPTDNDIDEDESHEDSSEEESSESMLEEEHSEDMSEETEEDQEVDEMMEETEEEEQEADDEEMEDYQDGEEDENLTDEHASMANGQGQVIEEGATDEEASAANGQGQVMEERPRDGDASLANGLGQVQDAWAAGYNAASTTGCVALAVATPLVVLVLSMAH